MSKTLVSLGVLFLMVSILYVRAWPAFVYAQVSDSSVVSEDEVSAVGPDQWLSEETMPIVLPQIPDVVNSIPEVRIESTTTIPDQNNVVEVRGSSGAALHHTDTASLVPLELVTVPDSLLVRTLASSSSNSNLPFTLIAEETLFAINEVPIFTFAYAKRDVVSTSTGLVSNFVTAITDTVTALYEGSVVEAVVDTVTDTFSKVVDFLIPTAEGQELDATQDMEQDTDTDVPAVPVSTEAVSKEVGIQVVSLESTTTSSVAEILPAADSEPSTTTPEHDVQIRTDPALENIGSIIDIDIENMSVSLSPLVTSKQDGIAITGTTAPVPIESFALVDGNVVPIHVLDDGLQSFEVSVVDTVFDVGEHALELHIVFEGQMHVAYYVFTVAGTIISMKPLTRDLFAVVVADAFGLQTLWLEEVVSGSVKSFEKLADETSMSKNPVLEFKAGILFWTVPSQDALIGFDVTYKTSFSQTLNTNSSEPDLILLPFGTYEADVQADTIQFEFIPEVLRI